MTEHVVTLNPRKHEWYAACSCGWTTESTPSWTVAMEQAIGHASAKAPEKLLKPDSEAEGE